MPFTGDKFTVATTGLAPPTPPSATAINVTATADLIPNPLEASFDTETHIVEAHWDINDSYRLDYIFGHFETSETIDSSWTGTPYLMFGTERPAEIQQDSHELRLTYDAGGRLNFVVGAYYWESDYEIRLRSWIAFAVQDVLLDLPQTTKQKTENKALFFEADYALTDQWKFTLGGRYSYDDKSTDQVGVVTAVAESDWGQYTAKVGLSYQMNDDLMFYATYSEGYRSGGFNGRVGSVEEAVTPYDPEFVNDYEFGFKSQWLDNRLRLNANFFYMEYDDKQEELQLPSATSGTGQKTLVVNAATATIWGIELDAQAYISENLSMRANLGYLDSGYDSFTFIDGSGTTVDFSNLDFRRAPEWTGTIDATYEWQMANGEGWVTGSYHFLGDHFVNITNDPEFYNPNQHFLDASINYSLKGYTISVYGRNLANEDGIAHGFDVAGLLVLWHTPSPAYMGRGSHV